MSDSRRRCLEWVDLFGSISPSGIRHCAFRLEDDYIIHLDPTWIVVAFSCSMRSHNFHGRNRIGGAPDHEYVSRIETVEDEMNSVLYAGR